MKPMDDVWKDISSLPSLHHPSITHHFQDFFAPATAARPPGGATLHHPSPPSPPPPPPTTMLSLSSTSGNSGGHDQENNNNNNSSTAGGATSPVANQRSPPDHHYTDKFKRLMKNRESAARSRARKQARADELEQEVSRLTKENAKLKRLHKELCSTSSDQFSKKPKLHRTRSAPF